MDLGTDAAGTSIVVNESEGGVADERESEWAIGAVADHESETGGIIHAPRLSMSHLAVAPHRGVSTSCRARNTFLLAKIRPGSLLTCPNHQYA